MSAKFVYLLAVLSVVASQTTSNYDAYTGLVITETEVQVRAAANQTFWCVNQVQACDETEWRRLDGTCNNLNNPQRGASHTPEYRYLPAVFSDDGTPRRAVSGNELPNTRHLRTSIWPDGIAEDAQFSTLSNYLLFYTATDSASQHDTTNFMYWRSCCPNDVFNENDAYCVRHEVPEDDPELSNTCLNLTKPLSFQTEGCTSQGQFDRIVTELPLIDLSALYGNNEAIANSRRLMTGGHYNVNLTSFNGIHVLRIWLGRNHNRIADELAALNPCWDDDTLFHAARDINLAQYLEILFYEYYPALFGYDTLVQDGILQEDLGFRDIYDETLIPAINTEYIASMRWFHNMQQSMITLMDNTGEIVGDLSLVDQLFATGWVEIDNRLEYLTHAAHRQPAAAIDYLIDPEIGNYGLGLAFQEATDITANDLAKSRYYGFQPYVKYLEYCHGGTYESFDDLITFMDEERIAVLESVYEDVNDIDFAAGLWSEKPVEGGFIPPTIHCVMSKHLLHNIKSDRHWYERPNRAHAFTEAQLLEIRKSTMAKFMCLNGDNVTEMQPIPFYLPSETNALISCDRYESIDFTQWYDASCATTTTTNEESSTTENGNEETTETKSQNAFQRFGNSIKHVFQKIFFL